MKTKEELAALEKEVARTHDIFLQQDIYMEDPLQLTPRELLAMPIAIWIEDDVTIENIQAVLALMLAQQALTEAKNED